jgi:hypothetical protein
MVDWRAVFEFQRQQALAELEDLVAACSELHLALRRIAPSYTARYLEAVPRMIARGDAND